MGGHGLMLVVGVIEIIAGGLVAFRPRRGAYVVMAWLLAITLNLLLIPRYLTLENHHAYGSKSLAPHSGSG
jgi:hypothetical protein